MWYPIYDRLDVPPCCSHQLGNLLCEFCYRGTSKVVGVGHELRDTVLSLLRVEVFVFVVLAGRLILSSGSVVLGDHSLVVLDVQEHGYALSVLAHYVTSLHLVNLSLMRSNPYHSSTRSPITGEGEMDSTRAVTIGIMAEELRMTVFGAVVGELMLERDIRSWTDLSKLLEAHGHSFEASRLSGWAYGHRDVDWRFVRALAEVLRLEAEERTRLAMTFAYGQGERVNESYLSVKKEPSIGE